MNRNLPHPRRLKRSLLAVLTLALAAQSWAIPVELDFVRNTGTFLSIGYDSSTGQYYASEDNGFESNVLKHYADINAFRDGTVSQTSTLQNYGTYVAVRDGKLFGRDPASGTGSNIVSRTDIATNTVEDTFTATSLSGTNGRSSFAWGGYSAMNFYNTANGMYLFSGSATTIGQGRVLALDENFNVTDSILVPHGPSSGSSLGYNFGFVINDYLYLGDRYGNRDFSRRVDLLTGDFEVIDFEFTNQSMQTQSRHISNVTYDHLSNTLFFAETVGADRRLFELTNAAQALGAVRASVPEPSLAALFSIGLFALFARRRSVKTNLKS